MLCLEIVYIEINMYVSLWSYPLKQVIGGRVAETRTPFTLLQDTVHNMTLKLLFQEKKGYITLL